MAASWSLSSDSGFCWSQVDLSHCVPRPCIKLHYPFTVIFSIRFLRIPHNFGLKNTSPAFSFSITKSRRLQNVDIGIFTVVFLHKDYSPPSRQWPPSSSLSHLHPIRFLTITKVIIKQKSDQAVALVKNFQWLSIVLLHGL